VQAPAAPSPAPQAGQAAPTSSAPTSPAPAAPATTGAPRNLFEAAAAASQEQTAQRGAGAGGDAGGADSSELDRLRDDPTFIQLRDLVRENPALLHPFLQQLGQSNPQLMELIGRNPDAFARLIAPELGGDEEGEEGGAQYIEVSDQDKANIDQLVGMGFDRQIVIQAYVACERNTELAASYLLEHGQEWEDEQDGAGGAGP
jgi:UV excision repair protein RAD23